MVELFKVKLIYLSLCEISLDHVVLLINKETLIDSFHRTAQTNRADFKKDIKLNSLSKKTDNPSILIFTDNRTNKADVACIATGSLEASPLSRALETLGHI